MGSSNLRKHDLQSNQEVPTCLVGDREGPSFLAETPLSPPLNSDTLRTMGAIHSMLPYMNPISILSVRRFRFRVHHPVHDTFRQL
jgi:hypothetical protein